MQLNHWAHGVIALVLFLLAFLWYSNNNPWMWWAYPEGSFKPRKISIIGYLILYALSLALVFVFMNLIIHQSKNFRMKMMLHSRRWVETNLCQKINLVILLIH